MKAYKHGLSLLFLLLIGTGCSQKNSLEWIPFNWVGDSISGKYIEKAYIYIPVKIDNLPHDFIMQFDLGTVGTEFYGNSIQPYLDEHPLLAEKLGSAQGIENMQFKNINLRMGTVAFNGINIWNHKNFGDSIPNDSLHSPTPKEIGTIAPDIFQDKVLVIDYKSSRLAVSDSLPPEYKDLPAETFELVNGLMKLPFRINGQDCKLLFDTGSSPFPLATSKERAEEIAAATITDSLSGPLWWGQDITFYGLDVNKPITFGGKELKSSKVYYDKDRLWEDNVFKPLNVWGLTGNAYFFDNTVIIDYRNKLFRVK